MSSRILVLVLGIVCVACGEPASVRLGRETAAREACFHAHALKGIAEDFQTGMDSMMVVSATYLQLELSLQLAENAFMQARRDTLPFVSGTRMNEALIKTLAGASFKAVLDTVTGLPPESRALADSLIASNLNAWESARTITQANLRTARLRLVSLRDSISETRSSLEERTEALTQLWGEFQLAAVYSSASSYADSAANGQVPTTDSLRLARVASERLAVAEAQRRALPFRESLVRLRIGNLMADENHPCNSEDFDRSLLPIPYESLPDSAQFVSRIEELVRS